MTNNYEFLKDMYISAGCPKNIREALFYTNDYPVPYKDLEIYPIKVDLYQIFHILVDCLILDEEHKQGGDPKAIPLNYLGYLFYKCKKMDSSVLSELKIVLQLCLHINNTFVSSDGEIIPSIDFLYIDNKPSIRIINTIYNSKDFDEIRTIICEQNCVEMPDLTIPMSLKKKYKEQDEFIRKQNKNKVCSLDEMKSRITGRTGITKDKLNQMTIREFAQLIESLEIITSYDTEIPLTPNMKKEDQQKIRHWLSTAKDEDKYAKYRMDVTKYAEQNKIEIETKTETNKKGE